MKTITLLRIALALMLLPALLRAEELFKGATAMDLPFPPGGREIVRLLVFNNQPIAVVRSADNTPAFFRPTDMATITNEQFLPAKLGELLVNPDLAFLPDVNQRAVYFLNDAGKLVKATLDGQVTEIGDVSGTRPFEDKTGFQISRAMVQGADGKIYTAGDKGAIFGYDPAANKLEKLAAVLPAVKGREPWASLDAAVAGPDGLIYGGTFDGYIFTFDPKTLQVVNLGKPFRSQRIAGLAFRNGKLYGIGGDPESIPRSFSYDPKTRGFEIGGVLPDLNDGAYPMLDPVGAMLGLPDGTIYYASTGRMADLFVWKLENK